MAIKVIMVLFAAAHGQNGYHRQIYYHQQAVEKVAYAENAFRGNKSTCGACKAEHQPAPFSAVLPRDVAQAFFPVAAPPQHRGEGKHTYAQAHEPAAPPAEAV